MKKKDRYHDMINEVSTAESLDYLTAQCNTRSKKTALKAKRLIAAGNFAEALKLADPIAYNVGLGEFK